MRVHFLTLRRDNLPETRMRQYENKKECAGASLATASGRPQQKKRENLYRCFFRQTKYDANFRMHCNIGNDLNCFNAMFEERSWIGVCYAVSVTARDDAKRTDADEDVFDGGEAGGRRDVVCRVFRRRCDGR